MKLGKQISGPADFSFQYFINDGFIGCTCSICTKKIELNIQPNNYGKPIEHITKDLNESILSQLLEDKIVNFNKTANQNGFGFSKYMLWQVDALYSIIICKSCSSKFLAIFGIGEIQPGREQVQFKGIWELKEI